MADEAMDRILKQARRLGELIREHPHYRRLREADAAVRDDADAGKALEAYNKAATAIQEKEDKGQPVEPEEKRDLDALRDTVVANETIKAFSQAQTNYADLMRRMNETIFQAIAEAERASAAAGGSSTGAEGGGGQADEGGESGEGGGKGEAAAGPGGPSIITPS